MVIRSGVRVSVSCYLSRQHLPSAELFRDQAIEIEARDMNAVTENEKVRHRAFVTGAVIFSVCYLEAAINEIYTAVSGNPPSSVGGRVDAWRSLLAELWETIEEKPILSKYQVALTACRSVAFDRGQDPYQPTDSLIRVRNALIHYRPENHDDLREHKKIQERLTGRFDACSFATPGTLWFPHFCLGAGCARWAVETVKKFMVDFSARLEISSTT